VRGDLAQIALRGWVGFVEATTLGWLAARDRVSRVVVRDMIINVAMTILIEREHTP
jgi:hypothetical protein